MKRLTCLLILVMGLILSVNAQKPMKQQNQRFSPEQFDAELQHFITQQAGLTHQEAAKFFPVYKEMQKKQRAIFERQRQQARMKPGDEKGCQKAIQERDKTEVELKRIQQIYHNKFLDILPASKVYDIIQAEDRFHRHKLRQWSNLRKPQGR